MAGASSLPIVIPAQAGIHGTAHWTNGDKVVILLLGGSKKGQAKDIELAQGYWKDYWQRVRAAKKAGE